MIKQIKMGHTGTKLRPNYKGNVGTYIYNNEGIAQGIPTNAMLFVIYFDALIATYGRKLTPQLQNTRRTRIVRNKRAAYKWTTQQEIRPLG